MGADLSLYIDTSRGVLVGGPGSLQPLRALDLIQAEEINVFAEFLQLTGNGLQPFVNIDPTGWTLNFGLGYIDETGTKQLIALAGPITALTSISGVTGAAATALAFVLDLATTAAATLLNTVYSSPIWAEASWVPSTATTAGYANKVQIQGTIKTGFLGVGLPAPI